MFNHKMEEFMKKLFILSLFLFVFLGNAYAESPEGNRVGVQFQTGGNLGLVYFGKDYGWAVGAQVGFKEDETTMNAFDEEWDTSSQEFTVFARKNFKLRDKTYIGLGVIASWGYWDEIMVGGADGVWGEVVALDTEAESFSIAPYLILDYHLSKNFMLNAGAKIVEFETIDYEWNGNDDFATKSTVSYFDPFFGLTYLF